MLTETEKQFIFKRTLVQKVTPYVVWSIASFTALAWGLMYWLKPETVSSQAVLDLLAEKTKSGQDLTQMTDIAVLAVTGATTLSAVFLFIILLAIVMNFFHKKEQRYLSIISKLQESLEIMDKK